MSSLILTRYLDIASVVFPASLYRTTSLLPQVSSSSLKLCSFHWFLERLLLHRRSKDVLKRNRLGEVIGVISYEKLGTDLIHCSAIIVHLSSSTNHNLTLGLLI